MSIGWLEGMSVKTGVPTLPSAIDRGMQTNPKYWKKLGGSFTYVNYTELVIKLTMSGGGVKIKWWIDKMGSIFSEVLWFKGILPLWSNNMFVMMCNLSEPVKMRASIVSHNTYCDYKAKLDWEADTFWIIAHICYTNTRTSQGHKDLSWSSFNY